MKRRSMIGLAGVAVLSLALPAGTLAVAPLTNGSFDAVTATNTTFDTLSAGSPELPGWTISGTVDLVAGYWPAADGPQSLDLNGNDAGAISQDFATVVGASYAVDYELSGNPDNPGTKTLDVSATGGTTDSESYDPAATGATLADMKWSTRQYTFTASATTTTLTFQSTTTGPWGPALDNITVTELAVPTAKLDCKKLGWTALTDAVATSFRNQGDCVSYVATAGRNVAAGAATHGASAAAHEASAVRHAAHVVAKPSHGHSAAEATADHRKSHSTSGKK
jgi:choice-of-anchor C domain-containing protein